MALAETLVIEDLTLAKVESAETLIVLGTVAPAEVRYKIKEKTSKRLSREEHRYAMIGSKLMSFYCSDSIFNSKNRIFYRILLILFDHMITVLFIQIYSYQKSNTMTINHNCLSKY